MVFLNLFLAVLGLHCRVGFSLVVVCRLLIVVASRCRAWALGTWASVAAACGSVIVRLRLSCFTACGILPDRGSNLCLLHWQADSYLLHHQGSPVSVLENTDCYSQHLSFEPGKLWYLDLI